MSVMRMEFDTEIAYKIPPGTDYSLKAINIIPSHWEIMDGFLCFPKERTPENVALNTKLEINSKESKICGTVWVDSHPIEYYSPGYHNSDFTVNTKNEPFANDVLLGKKMPSEIELYVYQQEREQRLDQKKELIMHYIKNGMAGRIGASRPLGRGAESPTIHINIDDCLYKDSNGYNTVEVFFFKKLKNNAADAGKVISDIEKLGFEKIGERGI